MIKLLFQILIISIIFFLVSIQLLCFLFYLILKKAGQLYFVDL